MNGTTTISSSTNSSSTSSGSTNPGSTNSSSTHCSSSNDPLRCRHHTSSGRRCRRTIFDESLRLCLQHARIQNTQRDAEDLTPFLLGDLADIRTAQDMHLVLGKLFILLAQNRVATRKAAVLTYIIQQLLRTLPAIDKELNSSGEDAQKIIIDIPRPIRD
jgi:hypothetical protein